LDEHVPHAIAKALRRRGINVTTTMEVKLLGKSDEIHLAFALQDTRVVYSQDDDFLIAAAKGIEHAGVAYNAPGSRTMKQIIDFLVLLDACLSPEEMKNHVEFVPQ
jgi:hypothetical protein